MAVRYKRDPYPSTAKFKSNCPRCSCTMNKGDQIFYWPATKKALCEKCGESDYKSFLESCFDEEQYLNQSGRY